MTSIYSCSSPNTFKQAVNSNHRTLFIRFVGILSLFFFCQYILTCSTDAHLFHKALLIVKVAIFWKHSSCLEFSLTLSKCYFSETIGGIHTKISVMDFNLILLCSGCCILREWEWCHCMVIDRIQRDQNYQESCCILVCISQGPRPLKKVL